MTNSIDKHVLLQTKLHRPRVTADLVHRPRLKVPLNSGLDHPLILVAAPAGFGKSTLLSAWLETIDFPNAWLSLNEADNDLGVFLAYFLGAIQTLFPDSLPETRAFLTSISLPDVTVIANSLINELDELDRDFILVLDDYHLIREQSIHELLNLLLQYPPPGMHLVIATRQDPSLSLGIFRARHQIAEIRGQDLRFSRNEIAEFVEHTVGLSLTDDALDVLATKTEGWATGLRLATLTLRYGDDVDSELTRLHAENCFVTDYLMSEVLAHVSTCMRNFLLKTSILDQVCTPLAETLLGADEPECDPKAYLAWLEQSNMFTVALDSRGEWYRYHHLFQELLREQLMRQCTTDEIDRLHVRASAWYISQGSLEEALHHALLGHDVETAVSLIAAHRHILMDSERWQMHERLLHMFPEDTIEEHPDLILMAAWMARLGRFDLARSLELVDQAEGILDKQSDPSNHTIHLKGEIDAIRSAIACDTATDYQNAIVLTQRALKNTPRAWYYVRSTAWLYQAVAYQMIGKLDRAYAALAEGAPEDLAENGLVGARIAGSRCFIEWMAGDMLAIPQGAAHLQTASETHHRRESLGWSHYLLSSVAYEHNDLKTAKVHAQAIEKLRFVSRPMAYLQSAFTYASIYQANGQPDHARQKLDFAFAFLKETCNEGLVPLAQAFQADLAVMQGNLDEARHWAATIGPFVPLTLMPYFYTPKLTLPKILLAQNTSDSLEQATEVLTQLHAFVTETHNIRATIQVLALQAMLDDAQGNESAGLAHLQEALTLAQPGGFIRLFVDLGQTLVSLLSRLCQAGFLPAYTGQILEAFGEPAPAVPQPVESAPTLDQQTELIELLTAREHEILTLLGKRLTDKEIAQSLFISHLTVKRHTSTIYQKLQVNGRREAVAKAMRFNLL